MDRVNSQRYFFLYIYSINNLQKRPGRSPNAYGGEFFTDGMEMKVDDFYEYFLLAEYHALYAV